MKKIILFLTVLFLISCGGSSNSSDSINESFYDSDYEEDTNVDYDYDEEDDDEYYDPEPTEVIEVQNTVPCPNCNNGLVPCINCGGRGSNPVYNPYGGYYENVPCGFCGGSGAFTCQVCYGNGEIESTSYQPSFKGGTTTQFVKTKHACGDCSCDGYWGIKHSNRTYEGKCQNTDEWGHTCNDTPEAHGLRSWKN